MSVSVSKNSCISDLISANKYIRKLKADDVEIKIPNLSDMKNVRLICFSDASFANLPNSGSQGGYIIFLVGDNDKCAPILWKSMKLKRVVRSTLAAETLALEEAVEACHQPRSLRPTNFVNWPWLSPLTHRERRHTVASHMERRHTETHKNTTQETHIETLRNTTVVYHLLYSTSSLKQRKTVNHSFFYFDLPRAGPVPFIHQFNKKPI